METKNILNLTIKKILLLSSLISFVVLFVPSLYKLFGNLSFLLLLIIVFVRPLADIFGWSVLKKVVVLRKELGIMCASFGLAHGIGYFIFAKLGINSIFSSQYWSLGNAFGWGIFALIISLPLLLTSNVYSMRLLGKNWKNLQRFTYLFFIMVVMHIIFLKPNDTMTLSMIVIAWGILWIMAYKKVKFENSRRLVYSLLGLVLIGYGFGLYYSHMNKPNFDTSNKDLSSASSGSSDQSGVTVSVIKTISISSKCIGCGRCARIAADYFSINHNTHKVEVISSDNYSTTLVSQAVSACPEGAISAS